MTGHSRAIWQSRMWPRSSTSSIQMASNGRAFGPPRITRRKRNWLAYKTLQSRRRDFPISLRYRAQPVCAGNPLPQCSSRNKSMP